MFSSVIVAAMLASAPQLVMQSSHNHEPDIVLLSPDGKVLATAATGDLRLWDMSSGLLLRQVQLPSGGIERMMFLRGGRAIAVGGSSYNAFATYDRVIELGDGSTRSMTPMTFDVSSNVAYSGGYTSDGLLLQQVPAWLGKPGVVEVWSLSDGKKLRSFPIALLHESRIFGLGSTAFAVCDQQKMKFFDVKTGAPLASFGELPASPYCRDAPVLSPDGKFIALMTADRGVTLRESNGATKEINIENASIHSLSFSSDGKTLFVHGYPARDHLRAWTADIDVATSAVKRRDVGVLDDDVVTYSLDDNHFVTITRSFGVRIFERKTAALERELPLALRGVRQIAFSPDGRLLGEATSQIGTNPQLKVWDLATGRIVRALEGLPETTIGHLAFTADGRSLAWAGTPDFAATPEGEGGVNLVDINSGERRTMAIHRPVSTFDFSRDGKWLAVAGRNRQTKVVSAAVLAVAGETELLALPSVGDVRFSADGTRFVAGVEGEKTQGVLYATDGWKQLKTVRWDFAFVSDDLKQIGWTSGFGSVNVYTDVGVLDGADVKPKKSPKSEPYFPGYLGPMNVSALAFSPDGTRMALGGEKDSQLFDLKTRKPVRNLQAEHPVSLGAIAYSRDGSMLATGGAEGTLILRDPHTGAPIATLMATSDTEGIVVLPSGEYLASKGALRTVAFRVGAHAYPFEQFDLKFNRPDAVLRALGKASSSLIDATVRARQKRLARAGFTEASLSADLALPELEVDRSAVPASTEAAQISLKIKASSTKATLDRLYVTVDDTPFDGKIAGIELREKKTKAIEQTVSVPILPGRNRIQVSVLDSQGVESLRETLEVRGDGAAKPGKLFVLAVGVSHYKDATYDLQYAAKDAQDLGAVFLKAPHFANVQLIPVLDREATRENFLAAREQLLQAEPGDEVLIFIAGHGLLDDKLDYYFATTDVEFEHPAARGLSFEDVEGLLDGVKARRKLLLMDTCNSGELDKGDVEVAALTQASADPRVKARAVGTRGLKRKQSLGTSDLSALLADLFADTRRGSGAVAISSAGGAEFALESDEWKNGVFTFALLDSLRSGSADKNKDGVVSASELREAVQTRVRELTAGRQSPTSRRENLAVDFAVY
jgi:WD40 repeat protein/uncharacterized caspase-like protein